MRTLRHELAVDAAMQGALVRWPRADAAWDAITWTISRAPEVGRALNEAGTVRLAVFEGARSIGMPTVEIIYEIGDSEIVLLDAQFREAKHLYAGRA